MKFSFLFLASWLGLSIAPCLADSAIFDSVRIKAEQGNASAQSVLGQMYYYGTDFHGTHLPRDDIEAYKWLALAVMLGELHRAPGLFDSVVSRMTPEQRAEGERRIAAWRRAHNK